MATTSGDTVEGTEDYGGQGPAAKYDLNFTQNVINAIGPKATPRLRQLMASLIRHVHDFARENDLTVEEWMKGVEMINAAGKMSDDKRSKHAWCCFCCTSNSPMSNSILTL